MNQIIDTYQNYEELSAHERKGIDYQILHQRKGISFSSCHLMREELNLA
ncbi:hypothetical protein OE903_08910 [Bacillus sp. B6(2022)]|nr:hypothetical protein [Bacillus sp. B6(2022)]